MITRRRMWRHLGITPNCDHTLSRRVHRVSGSKLLQFAAIPGRYAPCFWRRGGDSKLSSSGKRNTSPRLPWRPCTSCRARSGRLGLTSLHPDLSRFANVKDFCSWLGLGSVNRVRQALKMAAMSLSRSDSALGAFYRRLCGRMDKPRANTAVAHKLARMVYFMLRCQSGRAHRTGHVRDRRQAQVHL